MTAFSRSWNKNGSSPVGFHTSKSPPYVYLLCGRFYGIIVCPGFKWKAKKAKARVIRPSKRAEGDWDCWDCWAWLYDFPFPITDGAWGRFPFPASPFFQALWCRLLLLLGLSSWLETVWQVHVNGRCVKQGQGNKYQVVCVWKAWRIYRLG